MLNEKISRENFELKKFKYLNGQTTVDYSSTVVRDGDTYTHNHQIVLTEFPHPDLMSVLRKFEDHMVDVLGTVKAGDKEQRDLVKQKITATGLELKGEGDNASVKITAKFECSNEVEIALNSPTIKYEYTVIGIEEELASDVEEIVDEVYSFIYEDKDAQGKLDFEQSQESQEDDND